MASAPWQSLFPDPDLLSLPGVSLQLGARPPRLGGLSYTSPSWTGPSCTPKSLLHAYQPAHSYETPRRVVLIVCHGPPGDGRDRRGVVLGGPFYSL